MSDAYSVTVLGGLDPMLVVEQAFQTQRPEQMWLRRVSGWMGCQ